MPSTVRISDSGRSLLAELARDAGKSMTEILDEALETYRRDRFFAEAAAAYEALATGERESYRGEPGELDGTVADGLDDGLHCPMGTIPIPDRGEIWLADLNPVRGHEQAGRSPVLVVSVRPFNGSKAGLVVVVPITPTLRAIPWHVVVQAPEGGLENPSALLCEAVRSIGRDRLVSRRCGPSAGTGW